MRRESDDPNDAIPDAEHRAEVRRADTSFRAIALSTAALLLVIFVLQNLDESQIDFLFWKWRVALALPIGIAAVLGFVIGWTINWLRRRARRRAG
jgi:uncharacterized integral membrane protein